MKTTPRVAWLDRPAETLTFTLYRRSCGFHVLIVEKAETISQALNPIVVHKFCLKLSELPPKPTNRDVVVFAAHFAANPDLIQGPQCSNL